jgi:4-amino-4-deoxychorismate lyase
MEIGVEPIMTKKQPLLFPTTLDLNKQSPALQTPIFKAVLDVLPTRTTTFTRDKTHYRTMYNYARQCAGIQSYQDAKEVVLFNRDNQVMDGSITTPYFYRNGRWTTPHQDCGGQQGTTRRWALDQGICHADTIDISSIKHNEIIWLSNGVKGFFTARFVACNDRLARTPSYESRISQVSRNDSGLDEKHHILAPHKDEVAEDDVEPTRQKYSPEPGSDVFRNSAFDLDVFERALKL